MKMRPTTTCLYSAACMLLRSLSAASQSLASKPMLAAESLFLLVLFAIRFPCGAVLGGRTCLSLTKTY